MTYRTLTLDWKGKQLSGSQSLVVNLAAAQFPGEDRNVAFEFEHELCAGLITCKGRSTIGTFNGTVFNVYMGEVDGSPWTYEFLMVDGAAQAFLNERPKGWVDLWITDSKTNRQTIEEIDPKGVTRVKVRSHRRQ